MAKYVVSLGGNALGNNSEEQKQALVKVAEAISDLIIADNEVAIVHGNGPQVGMINLAFETSKETTYFAILINHHLRHHRLCSCSNHNHSRHLFCQALYWLRQRLSDKQELLGILPTLGAINMAYHY